MIQARIALRRSAVTLLSALTLLAAGGSHAQAPAGPPVREITKLAGEVYRFRNNSHYSVFAVTPAGIIATDPINADAAHWLKAEFKKRFNQPVRYLIYSHDHADHISGGEVFADTAIVVAQENAKRVIIEEKRPTAVPQLTLSAGTLTIELGGTVAEVTYLGPNHSDNSVVVRFPKERILFAVDIIPVKSLPFRNFPDTYLRRSDARLCRPFSKALSATARFLPEKAVTAYSWQRNAEFSRQKIVDGDQRRAVESHEHEHYA